MAQLLVRNLDDEIKKRLKKRAVEHAISMEAEVRFILANTLKTEKSLSLGLGSSISNCFIKIGLEEQLFKQIHNHAPC